MAVPAARYDARQRAAIEYAYADRGIRPLRRIAELAGAGELTLDGVALEPFHVPETSVRAIGERYAKRQRTAAAGTLAALPPRDAVERMRRELLEGFELERKRGERRRREGKPLGPEHLRQLARAAREIAALPGPAGEKPSAPAPGAHVDGANLGGATRGGLGASILARARPQPIAAENEPSPTDPAPEPTTAQADEHEASAEEEVEPGAFAAARIAELRATSVSTSSRRPQ